MIQKYPKLYQKILQIRNSDNLIPITLDGWEGRIVPTLFELEKSSGIQHLTYSIENDEILFVGNDSAMIAFLNENFSKMNPFRPKFHLYVFSGLKDLGILRRINEFPDETSRTEIEDSWLGLCEESAAMIIMNPVYYLE